MPGLRKRLIIRLGLCGIAIALIAGLLTYLIESARLDGLILQIARDQALHLVHLREVGGDDRLDNPHTGDLGDFPYIRLETNGTIREVWQPDLQASLRKRLDEVQKQMSDEASAHRNFTIDGRMFMRLAAPIPHGNASFTGIFRVGRELGARLDTQVIWSVLAVFSIVVATTMVLVPVILALEAQVFRHARDAIDAHIDTLETLGGAIAKRDSDTDEHNYRVTLIAIRMGELVSFSSEAMRHLIRGAFLHDVGKIAIPDAILLKPGRLTPEEFEIMKTHVRHGIDIISHSPWLATSGDIVAHHHEKFDGSGYPDGLAGEAIPVAARIFAIADVFDALTSRRPYKAPMPFDQAVATMQMQRGQHFDPKLLDVFVETLPMLHQFLTRFDAETLHQSLSSELSRYFTERSVD